MGRKSARTVTYQTSSDGLWDLLPMALDEAGIDVTEVDEPNMTMRGKKRKDQIGVGHVSVSGAYRTAAPARKTFGEKIVAQVARPSSPSDGPARCEVMIESRLRFGLIDWGENKKNVTRIHHNLREAMK